MSSNRPHYLEIEYPKRKVQIVVNGEVVAESTQPLRIKEVARKIYDPVYYFKPEEVKMDRLKPADLTTRCPIKGQASYFDYIDKEGFVRKELAWTYASPISTSGDLKGRIAFFGDQVAILDYPLS